MAEESAPPLCGQEQTAPALALLFAHRHEHGAMGPRSCDRGRLVADRVRQLPHLASMGPRTNDPATESEDLRQRFEREVKAAARLEHRRRVGYGQRAESHER